MIRQTFPAILPCNEKATSVISGKPRLGYVLVKVSPRRAPYWEVLVMVSPQYALYWEVLVMVSSRYIPYREVLGSISPR